MKKVLLVISGLLFFIGGAVIYFWMTSLIADPAKITLISRIPGAAIAVIGAVTFIAGLASDYFGKKINREADPELLRHNLRSGNDLKYLLD